MGPRSYLVSSKVSTQKLGNTSFKVSVDVNGKSAGQISGSANVDVKVNVLNTAKPLAKDSIINDVDLQIISTVLSKVPRDALLAPKQILGMQVRRSLTIGQIRQQKRRRRSGRYTTQSTRAVDHPAGSHAYHDKRRCHAGRYARANHPCT